jgi:dienelactone hydrolase
MWSFSRSATAAAARALVAALVVLAAPGCGSAHAQATRSAHQPAATGDAPAPGVSAGALPVPGPPDPQTRYWTIPGFAKIPLRGPERARGVVFWSHGIRGHEPQYQFPPAAVVRELAEAGWDVIKINRNNTMEVGWSTTGLQHVDDLVARATEARRQGYRHIIAAGQSYGGAIALEAGARFAFDAVIALAPGNGSDARKPGPGHTRWMAQEGWLADLLPRQQAQRLVVFVPDQDEFFPRPTRGPVVRSALARANHPFVVIDETSPLKRHGVGTSPMFRAAYGACLAHFLDVAAAPPSGESRCVDPPDDFDILLPPDLAITPPAPDVPAAKAALARHWGGMYDGNGRPVEVVVEQLDARSAHVVYAVGRGTDRAKQASWSRRTARFDEQGRLVSVRSGGPTLTLEPGADGTARLSWQPPGEARPLTAELHAIQ